MAVFRAMIILSLVQLCVYANKTDVIRQIIPDLLSIMCPRADVCSKNASETSARKQACCTECSCDDSCKIYNNCCFPDDDNQLRTGFGKATSLHKDGAECLFLSSKQPTSKYDQVKSLSVWMISSERESTTTSSLNKSEKCGEVKVAPWGTILPVSSKTTGNIYKNAACASAHNITDGITWRAALKCDEIATASGIATDMSRFMYSFEADNSFCHVDFAFPEDIQLKPSDVCYTTMIDKCTDNTASFKIPDELPASRNIITKACTSGLFSPYRTDDIYANVFCLICSGRPHPPFCTDMPETNFGGEYGTFTALIDAQYLEGVTAMENKPEKNQVLHKEKACLPDNSDVCKPVLCPSGSLRATSGKCVSPITSWMSVPLKMYIKLKADRTFILNEYIPVSGGTLDNLKTPVPKRWMPLNLYYKPHKESNTQYETNELLICYKHLSSRVKQSNEVRTVQAILNKAWQLLHPNGTSLKLRPSIWELSKLYPERVAFMNPDFENYANYYGKRPLHSFDVYFTKLSLCDMVELVDEEFELGRAGLFLLNKINNQTLGDAEFSLVYDQGGKRGARVCIEDSGLVKPLPLSVGSNIGVMQSAILVTSLTIALQMSQIM